jgi:uncharacterized membrane protein
MKMLGFHLDVWIILLGLFGNVIIAIKAVYEGYQQSISDFDHEPHKRAHIAALGAIFAYSLYDIVSFAWFLDIYENDVDYTISFFNLLFINIIWLFVIHHFKQERTGDYSKVTWNKLIKF